MTQLDISADLYRKLHAQARQSGQTLEEWLVQQATPDHEPDLSEFHTWFVRLVAHDLRTPLAAILTSSDILKHYMNRLSDERRVEHLITIQMQVRVLNNLLDNIMVIQKYEIGTLVYDPVPQNLDVVCHAAIQSASEMVYQRANIELQQRDPMPLVKHDENLIRLALTNVLVNAILYSPEGALVSVMLDFDEADAMIQIHDSGNGIPLDEQERVFDLFYRASNAQSVPGKGLGLPVVKRLIAMHGGSVHIQSALGHGTTTTIQLPL
jgi:K+-sensing histidine kinase KdpD